MVVGFLGTISLATVIFSGLLALDTKAIPGELIALGSGAIGALGALLAKTSTTPEQTQNIVTSAPLSAPLGTGASTAGPGSDV
jgi:hypothetical protein